MVGQEPGDARRVVSVMVSGQVLAEDGLIEIAPGWGSSVTPAS